MPVYLLDKRLVFPPPERAREDGLLAVGGDLSLERLLLAYKMGIFPWFSRHDPILWWSPDPRLVLFPGDLRVSRSLKKTIRKNIFDITADTAFYDVIRLCADVRLEHGDDTWIVDEMIDAYSALHEAGFAHSFEAWREGELVGGLYGVSIGGAFFGESMFSTVSNASKAAFVKFVEHLEQNGFDIIDCQVSTRHLLSLGAAEIPRRTFLTLLRNALKKPSRKGRWRLSGI